MINDDEPIICDYCDRQASFTNIDFDRAVCDEHNEDGLYTLLLS